MRCLIWRLAGISVTGGILGLSAAGAWAGFNPRDYLIQKVCVDKNDRPLAVDPYLKANPGFRVNPSYHLYSDNLGNQAALLRQCVRLREIRSGESFPYTRYSFFPVSHYSTYRKMPLSWLKAYKVPDTGFSLSQSYPVVIGGKTFLVRTVDYGNYGSGALPVFGRFDTNAGGMSDGYDLIDISGDTAAAVASRDQVFPNGNSFYAPNGTGEKTWVYFPLSAGEFNKTYKFSLAKLAGHFTSAPSLPADGALHVAALPSLTTWEHRDYTYTDGKKMDSLISYHWNDGDPAKVAALEVTFFTKEYGVTRWESWVHESRYKKFQGSAGAQAIAEEIYCPGPRRNGEWVRNGCADWTNLRVGTEGQARAFGGKPYLSANVAGHASRLVQHRAEAALGATSALNRGNSRFQTLSGWRLFLSGKNTASLKLVSGAAEIRCSPCAGDSVYQDLKVTGGRTVTFGGTLAYEQVGFSALAKDSSYLAYLSRLGRDGDIYLFEITSDHRVIPHQQQVSLSDQPLDFHRAIKLDPKTVSVRIQFYPLHSQRAYRLHSLFVK